MLLFREAEVRGHKDGSVLVSQRIVADRAAVVHAASVRVGAPLGELREVIDNFASLEGHIREATPFGEGYIDTFPARDAAAIRKARD